MDEPQIPPDAIPVHVTNILVGLSDIDFKSETQVAKLFNQVICGLPRQLGYTSQAIIEGLILAAIARLEDHFVRAKLPHKTSDQSSQDTNDLFIKINHLLHDYITPQTAHEGN